MGGRGYDNGIYIFKKGEKVFMNSQMLQHRGEKVNFSSMRPLRSNLLVENAQEW